jgi:hypothetical protein
MKSTILLLALLLTSCSTKNGVISVDTKPLKEVSKKVEKKKGYCSPLDKMMKNNGCGTK